MSGVNDNGRPYVGICCVSIIDEPQEHFGTRSSICVQPFAGRLSHPPFAARMRWLCPFLELEVKIELGGDRAIIIPEDRNRNNGRLLSESKSLYVDNHIVSVSIAHGVVFLRRTERADYRF